MIGRVLGMTRSFLRAHPRIERRVLWLASPFIPVIMPLLGKVRGPRHDAWFARWQASDTSEDVAIRAAVGEAPPFLIHVGDCVATRESLDAQVAARWTAAQGGGDAALQATAAAGGYVLFLEHGETLERHALAAFAIAAQRDPRPLVIYADEDRRDADGTLVAPWFKAAFDPYRLLQQESLGSAVAYDAGLLLRHGLAGLRGHALALAATRAAIAEAGEDAMRHLPAVLLHRDATAPGSPWREGTDAAAVTAALAPEGATIADAAARPLRILWPLPGPAPKVSVIIPTRDRAELLGASLEGLFTRTDYPDLEVIVVDNGSVEPATQALLQRWSADPRLRVLPEPGPFNYALLNNRAAADARGKVLVLLNNDTEVRHAGWLREMAALAIRPGIGAVGARLLFPNGRIQHAGVVLGPSGVAGHDYLFAAPTDDGAQDDLRLVRSVSAVTGACLAVRREHYLAVGGMDEARFRVAYNDVDFCLRLRRAGLRNLVTPHAELLHRESASRGSDFSPERRERWDTERRNMREAWGTLLDDDPFLSPLLSYAVPARRAAEPPRRLLPWRG